MTIDQEAKIHLIGVYNYLTQLIKDIQNSDNPKLALYANYSHIGEVVTMFYHNEDLNRFISEIGYNAEFMNMFREVSDSMQLLNRRDE